MILVDTSVWVEHLRNGNLTLVALLEQSQVVMHPLIVGELACCNLKNRTELLRLWQSLGSVPVTNNEEVLYFIEQHKLMGRGIGYIDVHLLASVFLEAGTKLWTLDKRLAQIASELSCVWVESLKE